MSDDRDVNDQELRDCLPSPVVRKKSTTSGL
jgi:hypothetical protein